MSSVDRSPLGDIAATLASVACTNPDVELRLRLRVCDRQWYVSTADIRSGLGAAGHGGIVVARLMRERIAEGLSALHVSE
jgi:hypothetical protein